VPLLLEEMGRFAATTASLRDSKYEGGGGRFGGSAAFRTRCRNASSKVGGAGLDDFGPLRGGVGGVLEGERLVRRRARFFVTGSGESGRLWASTRCRRASSNVGGGGRGFRESYFACLLVFLLCVFARIVPAEEEEEVDTFADVVDDDDDAEDEEEEDEEADLRRRRRRPRFPFFEVDSGLTAGGTGAGAGDREGVGAWGFAAAGAGA
jgi:hypothetical protein